MQVKKGFELKEMAESYVVIPTQENVVDFSSVIMLNETGAFLWLQLTEDTTEERLIKALLSEYDVDEEIAKRDVGRFLAEVKEAGVLEG